MFNQEILEQMAEANQVRANIQEEAESKIAAHKRGVEAIEFARSHQ